MERTDETTGLRELPVLRRGRLERIRHVRGIVGLVGHAPRLARVEAPLRASSRPQVQRGEGVDLPGMGDRRDRPENALRLVDARAVVRLNAFQIGLDDALRGDLFLEDGLLDLVDRGFLNLEPGRPSLYCLPRVRACITQQQEGHKTNQASRHRRAA